jgi:ABC-2 type transport system ATP-binding protein
LTFNGKFFGIPADKLAKRVQYLLERVGLAQAADRLLAKYSKGMLQRVGLAQAIVNEPEVVFLDEPMSGLDPLGRRMVKDLILSLKASGTTVFFNTHVLPDVEQVCDRFLILCQGRIVETSRVADLKEPLEDLFVRRVAENTVGQVEIR